MQISHESIYRYIYHRVEQKDYDWHRHLRRRKFHRGKHVRGGKISVETIKNRISIHNRPKIIAERKSFGHWEADLMSFQHNKQNILVASERKSRKIFAHKLPNKKSKTVRKRLRDSLKKLPPSLRRTITYDNGTEFAQHHELNVDCNMKSYFCDTHSPWQKGGVENGIGRLRQDLPEGTNLNGVTPQKLDQIVRRKNNTPRKCLGFLTPNEVWAKAIISSTVALQP
jgi:transposase, IS30 family